MSSPRFATVVFFEHRRGEIQRVAERIADPDHPSFGRHLTHDELLGLVALDPAERGTVRDWFARLGMEVREDPDNPQLLFVGATSEQVLAAFGEHPDDWRDVDMNVRHAPLAALPPHIRGYVQKVGGLLGDETQAGRHSLRPAPHAAPGKTSPSITIRPASGSLEGVRPADVREIYGFPDRWDGSGETIALLMLGGEPDIEVVREFWRAHDIDPPDVQFVQIGPRRARPHLNPLHDAELDLDLQWAGAMAPGARIVVYFADPAVMGDPWSAFLLSLLHDHVHRPTVASISWVAPERDYYRRHGHSVITGLLAQAACVGTTVVAAAGDWGAFDGVPRTVRDGRYVTDAPWPHAVFPAVEEGVLGVGGTMVTCRSPLTEVAWSAPPPAEVQHLLPLAVLAGSGGFSDEVPIPRWQRDVMRPYYPRGASAPAVVPYGRGFPDVALMAAGPVVQYEPNGPLSSLGYRGFTRMGWIDVASGTSIGAPIWAAIVALANQARREAGLGRVGWVNPLLYRLAAADPAPFRQVTAGSTDVVVYALNGHGKAAAYRLDGFVARQGWDPVTGLGVPNVSVLIDHLRGEYSDVERYDRAAGSPAPQR